jgi:hypothetical protein
MRLVKPLTSHPFSFLQLSSPDHRREWIEKWSSFLKYLKSFGAGGATSGKTPSANSGFRGRPEVKPSGTISVSVSTETDFVTPGAFGNVWGHF